MCGEHRAVVATFSTNSSVSIYLVSNSYMSLYLQMHVKLFATFWFEMEKGKRGALRKSEVGLEEVRGCRRGQGQAEKLCHRPRVSPATRQLPQDPLTEQIRKPGLLYSSADPIASTGVLPEAQTWWYTGCQIVCCHYCEDVVKVYGVVYVGKYVCQESSSPTKTLNAVVLRVVV